MFSKERVQKIAIRFPMSIIAPMLAIVLIGVINIASAASATRPDLYLNQLARFLFALSLSSIVAVVHTRILRRASYAIYVFTLLLLMMVLVMGTTVKGAERWLVLGPLRLQPSDPAKLALILAVARYCSLYWPKNGYSLMSLLRPLNVSRPIAFLGVMVFLLVKDHYRQKLLSTTLLSSWLGIVMMIFLLLSGIIWVILSLLKLHHDRFRFELLVAPIDVVIAPFLLIVIEPDLGTSLIVLSIAGIMFLYIGIKKISLMIGFVAASLFGVFSYFVLLMDYQRQRIITFLNPTADIRGEGYHSMQSIIAIGSGQILGKGYNNGTQTQLSFLPENSTDFVFSVWAEEWGFFACVFLLGLYFILLKSILNFSFKVEDKFCKLICIGVAANLFLHVIINIGMVTGLMPVVGVPLPLMSYGGSSMVITIITIALVVNVALYKGEK